tara:strand:- start:218 stop:475 length:258 start_codon:yes stop_codon:yes gene_type:complete
MIDDTTKEDETFERMLSDFEVVRPRKIKNKRKYSEEKTQQYRARRLAKKARQERIANEKEAIDMLNHQLHYVEYNKKYDNGESIS